MGSSLQVSALGGVPPGVVVDAGVGGVPWVDGTGVGVAVRGAGGPVGVGVGVPGAGVVAVGVAVAVGAGVAGVPPPPPIGFTSTPAGMLQSAHSAIKEL